MKIRFFLAWYDLWVGIYVSRKDKTLYICLLPCCVIMISLPKKTTWLTVNDISRFRKGGKIEIYGTDSSGMKAELQKFKALRLFPKKSEIKVKKIT